MRRLLTRHFGPPHDPDRVISMKSDMAEIVGGLIDNLAGRDQSDLVEDVTYPFPVTVICRLLGVPREDAPRFRVWADAIVNAVDPTTGDFATRSRRRDEAATELGHYLGDLADGHRDDPGSDMLSELATDDGPEGRLTRDELMTNAALLLIAGHETTVNLIANGMLTLAASPRDPATAAAAPRTVCPDRRGAAALRTTGAVPAQPGAILDDIDVAGTTIPRGSAITLVLAAGSRDPDHVAHPDQFDPDRPANEHLGFGGGDPLLLRCAASADRGAGGDAGTRPRLENLRLVSDPPPYRPNPLLRGPRHLPVQYDGRRSLVAQPRGVASSGRAGRPYGVRTPAVEPDRPRHHAVVALRRVLKGRHLANAPNPGLHGEPHRLLDLLRGSGCMPVQRLLPDDQLQRADFHLVRRDADSDQLAACAQAIDGS